MKVGTDYHVFADFLTVLFLNSIPSIHEDSSLQTYEMFESSANLCRILNSLCS